jgi:hypothetical protein
MTNKEDKLIEITRSFSFKLNLGNYQMADFFTSEKCECLESEKEKKSEELYNFCKNETFKSVNKYLNGNKKTNAEAIEETIKFQEKLNDMSKAGEIKRELNEK